jgi:mono/diheme cytochrome c family protein
MLGAEKKRLYLSGGQAEGWDAPAINANSRAPVPWTAASLFRYLRGGNDDVHEVAAGPMAPVAHNMSAVPESEVRNIASYIASLMGEPSAERQKNAQQALARAQATLSSEDETVVQGQKRVQENDNVLQTGATIYSGSCAMCHGSSQRPPGSSSSSALHLALSSSVSLGSPNNLIRIILQGLAPADGERGPFMPGFSGALTDEQTAALAKYLRATFSDRPEWRDVEREVRKVRQTFAQANP